jgi:hypothetical protein
MSNLDEITRAKYVSGEMFDLTAASFNNTFGAKHNKCIIQHGINFPLSKFIDELKLIIATNSDDKTIKRQHRLDFLLSCDKCNEVQELFYLFSNFLNGGGNDSTRSPNVWARQQYYNNNFIITAAGGNIIILLAQLLANMIDVFKCKVNAAAATITPSALVTLARAAKIDPAPLAVLVAAAAADAPSPYPSSSSSPYPAPVEFAPAVYPGSPPPPRPPPPPAAPSLHDGSATNNWDIHKQDFESQDFETENAFNIAKVMFLAKYDDWPTIFWDLLDDTFTSLLRMNKILLQALDEIRDIDKAVLCFIMVKHFIKEDIKDNSTLDKLWGVALSEISDFDFKLSPNVHPMFSGKPLTDPVDELTREFAGLEMGSDEAIGSFLRELDRNIQHVDRTDSGGFLLFRVKTFIDCSEDYVEKYTGKELKRFQLDCARNPPRGLENKVWGLYPQIMQQSYLDAADPTSNCWKFLNHLNEKKQAIRNATQNSIDETMKFYQAGYFKPANSLGELFPVVDPAQNSTEAIINYISTITFYMNKYIENWESISVDRIHRLSSNAAPALHQGGLPSRFSYTLVCLNFLSLDSIVNEHTGLIPRLAADILNYFLNSPYFNTEMILDNLIESFKNKRETLTGTPSTAFMPPSDLLAVPTNKKFNDSLRTIKTILEEPQYSELGYPDGIRITLNAIETKDLIGDTNIDAVEHVFQNLAKHRDPLIETAYAPLQKKVLASGLKRKARKSRKARKARKLRNPKKTHKK